MVALLMNEPAPLDIRIHEKEYTSSEPIGGYVGSEFTWNRNEPDKGKLIVQGNHRHARDLMACVETVVPITTMVNGKRWSGRVFDYEFTGPDNSMLSCTLAGDMRMVGSMLAYPNSYLPEWIQFPPQDIFIGGARPALSSYVYKAANRARLPIVVTPYNFWDASEFVVMSARMDPLDELFSQVLKDADLQAQMNVWLPGDPQPFPNRYTMFRPALLWSMRDKRMMTDDIQWSVQGGGIKDYIVRGKHPSAHTVMVGGKSPDIINTMIREAVNMLIAAALSLIGLPFLGSIGGLLDDILFAFNRFIDYERKAALGLFGFPESFTPAAAGAFTLDALQAGLQHLKDTAGTTSVTFTVQGDKPHQFGVGLDERGLPRYDINDVVTFRNGPQIIHDYVSSVTVRDDRANRLTTTTTIGDPRTAKDPIAQMIGMFKGLSTVVRSMNLQT